MAKNDQITYLKVGEKASGFFDPHHRLSLSPAKPGFVIGKIGKKLREAIKGGHVEKIKESEYNDILALNKSKQVKAEQEAKKVEELKAGKESEKTEEELKASLELKSKDELIKLITDHEKMTADKFKEDKVSKMNKADLIDYLESLDEEEEKEEDDDEEDDDDEDQ